MYVYLYGISSRLFNFAYLKRRVAFLKLRRKGVENDAMILKACRAIQVHCIHVHVYIASTSYYPDFVGRENFNLQIVPVVTDSCGNYLK